MTVFSWVQSNLNQFENLPTWDVFYRHGLTLIQVWESNHLLSKLWDGITYPFPNFNGCLLWSLCHFHFVTVSCFIWLVSVNKNATNVDNYIHYIFFKLLLIGYEDDELHPAVYLDVITHPRPYPNAGWANLW